MNVIVTIQHPGHVHFFKHAVAAFQRRGHEVHVFARENEMTVDLLRRYGIDHEVLAGSSDSLLSLAAVQATYETRLLRRARRIDPDVVTAIGGVAAAHVAAAVGAKSVVFYDTEHATVIKKLAYPFADAVCTPACYRGDIGDKQVRYPGVHELAYLHPDRFTPDPSGVPALDADRPLVVGRFSSWDSSHDIGQGGFGDLRDAVDRLEAAGARVVLTSEVPLPDDLADRRIATPPNRIHDLLAGADLVVSEGATTAAESAVLGTPAVYVNSLSLGYTAELEDRYGLLFGFNGPGRHDAGLETAVEILADGADDRWVRRRERLLAETVDVTDVVVREVESAASGRATTASDPGPTSTRP